MGLRVARTMRKYSVSLCNRILFTFCLGTKYSNDVLDNWSTRCYFWKHERFAKIFDQMQLANFESHWSRTRQTEYAKPYHTRYNTSSFYLFINLDTVLSRLYLPLSSAQHRISLQFFIELAEGGNWKNNDKYIYQIFYIY